MKNIFLILFLFLFSCSGNCGKPFIISSKDDYYGGETKHYQYIDSCGNTHDFYDSRDYFIGDTLK